jgi:hypothetical protein
MNSTNNSTREGHEWVDISLNLPVHAIELFKQVFASSQGMAKTTSAKQAMSHPTVDSKGKEIAKVEEIYEMSKATTTEIPESSHQATEMQGSGKNPYYWRCFTKGHGAADRTETMYCPICDCKDHAKEHCPKWRGDKPTALLCGYAVEGLGVFSNPPGHD